VGEADIHDVLVVPSRQRGHRNRGPNPRLGQRIIPLLWVG